MESPLVVMPPPDHSLCTMRRIPVKRLEQEIFLIREPGSVTRSAMGRFFAAHKITIHKGMETDTNEAIKQAVQAGMGLVLCHFTQQSWNWKQIGSRHLKFRVFPSYGTGMWYTVKINVFQVQRRHLESFIKRSTGG